ncbi:MAG: hypothetical protein ABSB84_15920 [Verrucomicrobiota bacterium]
MPGNEPSHRPVFVTTHWSVVLTAARSDTTCARVALENLCQTYWHPLYAYVRRRGYSPEDAQDLNAGILRAIAGTQRCRQRCAGERPFPFLPTRQHEPLPC